MAVKAQGTDIWALYNGTLIKADCITSFTPGDDTADQLETTCLSERKSRTYDSGLANPAQASIAFNFDPSDPFHMMLWEAKNSDDQNTYIDFFVGFSDGTSEPTIAASGSTTDVYGAELPSDRTWYAFEGQVAGYAPDFQQNALVTATATITRSGAPVILPKSSS